MLVSHFWYKYRWLIKAVKEIINQNVQVNAKSDFGNVSNQFIYLKRNVRQYDKHKQGLISDVQQCIDTECLKNNFVLQN